MDPLVDVLRHERELLESLLFRLVEAAFVATADAGRWRARAASDLDEAVTLVRRTELLRALTAGDAALEVGLDPDAPLRSLAETVGQPGRSVLLDHRDALETLSLEIVAATHRLPTAERFAGCELRSLAEFLR